MVLGGSISLLALIVGGPGPAATAAAPRAPMMRVDFDAPAGCSSADAFRRGVASRLVRTTTGDGLPAIRIQVRLTRAGARVVGELRLSHEQAAADTRTVEGASCDEVVDVLALTAALALQPASPAPAAPPARSATTRSPGASASPAPVARGREGQPVAGTSSASASASASGASRAPPTPSAAPATAPTPKPPVEAAPPPPAPPPPPAAPVVETAIAERPPTGAGRTLHLEVGAGAALARVLSSGPTVNLGGALMVGLSRARGDRVPWSLRVAWLYLPNNFLLPEGEVVDRWNAFALSACPGWGWRHSGFQGQACGRAIGGWITATDRAVTNPRSATRSWWGVGALLRGAAEIGAGFSLELEAGIDAPLVDRQFITTTPLHTVAETPPLSVFVGLGLSRRL